MLPKRIFFTGVPGSKWSAIAQTIETISGMNTSDRTSEREYNHHLYSGHKGAYFGEGMELEPMLILTPDRIDGAWSEDAGCKLVKSHDWAHVDRLDFIKDFYPDDWIMMVYRPDQASFAWWHEAGGFQIKYPNYQAYIDSPTMLTKIMQQNNAILEFGQRNDCKWEYFTAKWVLENFGVDIEVDNNWSDILVTIIKKP